MENRTTPASSGGWLDRLGLGRSELRSWALYDWANSAFATTIMAAVLPIYYARVAAGEMPGNVATAYWGYTVSLSILVIVVLAPVLGAVADFIGAKKRFLGAFLVLGLSGTAALALVGEGDWVLASVLFVLANVGYNGSIVFYDSLLPHIAGPEEVDRASAGAWAIGYVGGGLLLLVNLVMIQQPELFGFADTGVATRWAFVSVAVWWAIFSIPLFRNVPEPDRQPPATGAPTEERVHPLRTGVRRLVGTFRAVRRYPDAFKFLLAFWLYVDGIETIIKMATIYGTEIGIGQGDLIGALLLVQFVGIPFTFAFGGLAGRIGPKRGILLALTVYTVIAVFGYFMQEAWHFWALAIGVGLVQGGAQSLSRSLYATLVPQGRSAEFFSFYSVFRKSAGVLGPLVFGVVAQVSGTSRLGILSLLVFFVGGMLLLSRVDVEAGRRAARTADPNPDLSRDGTPLAL